MIRFFLSSRVGVYFIIASEPSLEFIQIQKKNIIVVIPKMVVSELPNTLFHIFLWLTGVSACYRCSWYHHTMLPCLWYDSIWGWWLQYIIIIIFIIDFGCGTQGSTEVALQDHKVRTSYVNKEVIEPRDKSVSYHSILLCISQHTCMYVSVCKKNLLYRYNKSILLMLFSHLAFRL